MAGADGWAGDPDDGLPLTPQLASRNFFGEIARGAGSAYPIVRFPGRPELTSRTRTPAPELAQNADEILGDLLQLSTAERASLYAERVCSSPETLA